MKGSFGTAHEDAEKERPGKDGRRQGNSVWRSWSERAPTDPPPLFISARAGGGEGPARGVLLPESSIFPKNIATFQLTRPLFSLYKIGESVMLKIFNNIPAKEEAS
jgi:hypothetical protein